ncbi:hypothetical protein COOONC_23234 [Cooperia oncophora]
MRSLPFVLIAMGVTLSRVDSSLMPQVQPVPRPEDAKQGHSVIQFKLGTNIKFEDCIQDYSECMRFFDDTKIMEYSKAIGDLSAPMLDMDMGNGLMLYSFAIERADCDVVKRWTDQIVRNSPVFISADVTCPTPMGLPVPQAQPVPEPEDAKRGYSVIQFTLDTNVKFEDCMQDYFGCMRFFDETKIMEYSKALGELSAPMLDMNIENGPLGFVFRD